MLMRKFNKDQKMLRAEEREETAATERGLEPARSGALEDHL